MMRSTRNRQDVLLTTQRAEKEVPAYFRPTFHYRVRMNPPIFLRFWLQGPWINLIRVIQATPFQSTVWGMGFSRHGWA